jgi:hypothetical protein
MDYGTLRVTTPDGQVREYPLDTAVVVVGRSDGNGVVIDHVSVSRRHAQLLLNDEGLAVEDLGSANGTFIGSQRLASNAPTKVEDGQAIRFGDVEAHFLTQDALATGPAVAGHAGSGGDAQGTIGVSLASPATPVAVGQATTATVVVQNRGNTVDQLTLSVIDLPASWVRISRPTLSLVPGARDEVTIVIQPPRSPDSSSGEHPFSVAVVSGENGREVRVLGTCTILPFDGFTASLQHEGGAYSVVVENQGNSTMTYLLSATSDGGVNTKLEHETLDLAPGANATVAVDAAAAGRPLFGNTQIRRFQVHVKPARGAGQEVTSEGQVTVRPPLRHWKVPVAILALLVLFGGGGYAYSQASCSTVVGCSSKAKNAVANIPTAGGNSTTTPVASATTAPVGLRNGVTAVVVNSASPNCLNVRKSPSTDAANKPIGQLCDGQKVKITSDKVEATGFVWWSIDNGQGLTGWAAEKPSSGSDVWLQLSQ